MSTNKDSFITPPIAILIKKIKNGGFLYFLKLLVSISFPLALLVFGEHLTFLIQCYISRGLINIGYGPFNPYIPAIDGPIGSCGQTVAYQYGIPYVSSFKFIYGPLTNCLWALSSIVVFIFYGERNYYRYIEFAFIWFLFWIFLTTLFPMFNVLDNDPSFFNNYGMAPSGHSTVAYLALYFVMRNKTYKKCWYNYLIIILLTISCVLIMLSTLFTKQHYFMDVIITIAGMELIGLIMYFIHKKRTTNFIGFIFYNINQIYGVITIQENPYFLISNNIERLRKNKIYMIILWILYVLMLVGVLIYFLVLW